MKLTLAIVLLLQSFLISAQKYTEWFTSKYPKFSEFYNQPGVKELTNSFTMLSIDSLETIAGESVETAFLDIIKEQGIREIDSIEYHYMYLRSILSFNELKQRDHVTSDSYFYFAVALEGVNLFNESVYYFTRAFESWDESISSAFERDMISFSRGEVKLKKEDYYGAISDATFAIDNADEPHNRYYFLRGKSYCLLEQFENAIIDLTKSIELYPKNLESYYLRGLAYFFSGEKVKACVDFSTLGDYGYNNDELLTKYCK